MKKRRDEPGVMAGYRAFCIGMVVVSIASGILVTWFWGFVEEQVALIPDPVERGRQMASISATGPIMWFAAVFCYLMAVPYVAGIFIPRRFWGWIVGMVLIALGLTSCPSLPFAVWLGVLWLRPAVREWFEGKTVESSAAQAGR